MAGDAAKDRTEFLAGTLVAVQPPLFPDPSSYDVLAADLWATGISTDDHPLVHYRSQLDARGVLTARGLRTHEMKRPIEVAGLVTHRQRPATASGITFSTSRQTRVITSCSGCSRMIAPSTLRCSSSCSLLWVMSV